MPSASASRDLGLKARAAATCPVTTLFKQPCGCWEFNFGSTEVQPSTLNAKPSVQTHPRGSCVFILRDYRPVGVLTSSLILHHNLSNDALVSAFHGYSLEAVILY